MRMASSRQAAAGSVSARETPAVEACQVLTSLVAEDEDRKPVFLAEGGVIARRAQYKGQTCVLILHEYCLQEAVLKYVFVRKHS